MRYGAMMRASIYKLVSVSVALAKLLKDLSVSGRRGGRLLLAQGDPQQHGDLATCAKIVIGFVLCQAAATPKHIKKRVKKSRGGPMLDRESKSSPFSITMQLLDPPACS